MDAVTMHSSGNSFIVALANEQNLAKSDIAALCKAAKVDGMILIKSNSAHDHRLSFFNNDGSPFKMCFNGSLCAAMYLQQVCGAAGPLQFITENFGRLEASIAGDVVSLAFGIPAVKIIRSTICEPGVQAECYSLSLTDNHKIIVATDNFFDSPAFTRHAMNLRAADAVFAEGANVHFVHPVGDVVYIRHFEKGIEKETLSCGSGCVAAAIILDQTKELRFVSPGGQLHVKKEPGEWVLSGAPCFVSLAQLK